MALPPFVRRCREAPRVQISFVFAEVRQEAQLFGEGVDAGQTFAFFFHAPELPEMQRMASRQAAWTEEEGSSEA